MDRDDLRDILGAARRVHFAFMAAAASLFVLGLAPLDAKRYEAGLRILEMLPDLPPESEDREDYWADLASAVDELKGHREAQLSQAPNPLESKKTGKRIADPDGVIDRLYSLSLAGSDVRRPESKSVGELAAFLDTIHYVVRPHVDRDTLLRSIIGALPDDCKPCELSALTIHRLPHKKEEVRVHVELMQGAKPSSIVVDDVPLGSETEVLIERALRLGFRGFLEPSQFEGLDRMSVLREVFLTGAFWDDLRGVLPEVRTQGREEAIATIAKRAREAEETITVFGIELDEQVATLGGPLLLLCLSVYLLLHTQHVASTAGGADLITLYPWAPLFSRSGGGLIRAATTVGLIAAAGGFFLHRVWSATDLNAAPSIGKAVASSALVAVSVVVSWCTRRTLSRMVSEQDAADRPRLRTVQLLADELGITVRYAALLYAHGIESAEAARTTSGGELEAIEGIGPAVAAQIVGHGDAHT